MSSAPQPISTEREDSQTASSLRNQFVVGRALAFDLAFIVGWVALTDALLYRMNSFLAWSIFFAIATVLLRLPRREAIHSRSSWCIALLLLSLGAKCAWAGSWLSVACGSLLVFAYAMSLSGTPPFLPELFAFFGHVISGAVHRMRKFRFGTLNEASGVVRPFLGLQIVIPFLVVSAFLTLFTLANPHVAEIVGSQLRYITQNAMQIVSRTEATETLFWLASAWMILGMLYPAGRWLIPEAAALSSQPSVASPLFAAYRNTLASVCILFLAYIPFEFSTLWFREFPENFYYAGYAHEGAFWLTIALAFSTVTLSIIFSGKTLNDPKLQSLKRMAFAWSALNVLLSLAVVNRLFIYIDFNGMTRMRVIGLLGILCVVAGFTLVVLKIARNRSLVWLVHRQLWVPVGAAILFAIAPVDWLICRYNTSQVLSEQTPAVVQVVAHRTSAEGILGLLPLADSDNETIREGMRAILALWASELDVQSATPGRETSAWQSDLGHSSPWIGLPQGFSKSDRTTLTKWQSFQLANWLLENRLRETQAKWEPFRDTDLRDAAINRFFQYAYQWY